MPPGDISVPFTVFPVLNFIQDVEILRFQDPNEVLSYLRMYILHVLSDSYLYYCS